MSRHDRHFSAPLDSNIVAGSCEFGTLELHDRATVCRASLRPNNPDVVAVILVPQPSVMGKSMTKTPTAQTETRRRYSNSLSALGMDKVIRSRPKRPALPWRNVFTAYKQVPPPLRSRDFTLSFLPSIPPRICVPPLLCQVPSPHLRISLRCPPSQISSLTTPLPLRVHSSFSTSFFAQYISSAFLLFAISPVLGMRRYPTFGSQHTFFVSSNVGLYMPYLRRTGLSYVLAQIRWSSTIFPPRRMSTLFSNLTRARTIRVSLRSCFFLR
jgi:hypothetical protein